MDEKIKRALVEIAGEENYTDSLIDMVSFSYDASEHSHRPSCAVWAETADQVSEILKLSNREKIPVIPRGAGTGLSGMAVPIEGGIILDLSRMNHIVKISIEDRLAIVEPGVVYVDLEKALAPFGFFFPPDPASGKVSTLGGNVATNAGGLKGAKYGTTRDYVLGLQVVLPDGRIMRTGSKAMKSVSGYDLTRLFVGSEGTLAYCHQYRPCHLRQLRGRGEGYQPDHAQRYSPERPGDIGEGNTCGHQSKHRSQSPRGRCHAPGGD